MKLEMRQKLAREPFAKKSGKWHNSSGWRKLFPAAPARYIQPPNEIVEDSFPYCGNAAPA
jgi:hypothetical protein